MGVNIYDRSSWPGNENPNTNERTSLDTKKTTLFVSTLVNLASILWPLDPSAVVEDLQARRKIVDALKASNTDILEKLTPKVDWWEKKYKQAA